MKLTYLFLGILLLSININAQTKNERSDYNNWFYKRLFANSSPQTSKDTINVFTAELQRQFNEIESNWNEFVFDWDNLRKNIILISVGLKYTLSIPEEARANFIEGVTLMNDTSNKKSQDYDLPIQKLYAANALAPWWNEVYKKLGIAHELAEDYELAILYFQLYLLTQPPPEEARQVQDEIYINKAKAEKEHNEWLKTHTVNPNGTVSPKH